MTDSAEAQTLTRQQLYELVWSVPMRRVAAQYGLSDRGLAKLCERHRIPAPGRGYWAKKAAGHRVSKASLPALPTAPATLDAVILGPRVRAPVTTASEILTRQSGFEGARGNLIVVAGSLRGAHPLVRQTADSLAASTAPQKHILCNGAVRHLDIQVSREQLPRAVRIIDAVVKAFGARGWNVTLEPNYPSRSYVTVLEQQAPFGVREKLKKVKSEPAKPVRGSDGRMYTPFQSSHEDVPSGKLSLVLRDTVGTSVRRDWDDTDEVPLEDRLNEFMIGVVARAEEQLDFKRRVEANARQRREAEQQRYQAERARQQEAARMNALEPQANAWDQSRRIAAYVAAIREVLARASIAAPLLKGELRGGRDRFGRLFVEQGALQAARATAFRDRPTRRGGSRV